MFFEEIYNNIYGTGSNNDPHPQRQKPRAWAKFRIIVKLRGKKDYGQSKYQHEYPTYKVSKPHHYPPRRKSHPRGQIGGADEIDAGLFT